MKMMYGNVPIKSLNVKHYELNTNSATVQPSDLQVGITAYAKGRKVTGTGKAFEFANYSLLRTNMARYVPSNINIIELASVEYPVRLTVSLSDLNKLDFSIGQKIATVTIDNIEYDLTVSVNSNILKVICEKTFAMQVFYGKDNYI